MSFFRLIKPDWAKPKLNNGQPNPKFVQEIQGPDTIDGTGLTLGYLTSKNQEGYNLYFFPNHPSTDVYKTGVKYLAGKHIDTFNFIFVDMDLKDEVYSSKEEFLEKIRQFPIKPTMVVNSGNGIHVYWGIEGLTRDEYVFSQLALIKHFKTDESVFTVLQLMRLPGFMNTKRHGDFVLAEVLEDFSSNSIYKLSDFPQELFNLTEEEIKRGQRHLDRLEGKLKIDLPEYVNVDDLPEKFIEFINDPANKLAHALFHTPREAHNNDRSGADMKLANILFKAGFNKKEALAVISNTQKALSHANTRHYAELTIDKVYTEKLNSKFLTVGQRNRTVNPENNLGSMVKGTWYFDTTVLGFPWRKREILGLIAGAGVGKTSVTLKWMKDAIENNSDNDDVYVFFSLEMSEGEIIERWNRLVGPNSKLADRLYVIGNENQKGEPRNIGIQEILEDCQELKKLTGKNIGMLAIDHIGILGKQIDTRKKYTFGIQSEPNSGFGDIRTLSLASLVSQMKPLSKLLDTFIIVLTQTTKGKGQGDLPIDKDGAFGVSQYENIMDRIVTIWQPLQRVQHLTHIRFLAWQYVKIRNKNKADRIQTYEPKLLTFELDTGDLKVTTQEEYQEFQRLYPQTIEIRDALTKQKGLTGYSIHVGVDILNKTRAALGLVHNNESNNGLAKIQSN